VSITQKAQLRIAWERYNRANEKPTLLYEDIVDADLKRVQVDFDPPRPFFQPRHLHIGILIIVPDFYA